MDHTSNSQSLITRSTISIYIIQSNSLTMFQYCVLLMKDWSQLFGNLGQHSILMRELPSGLNESMEDPLIVAQRELFEETGYCSFSPFIFLGKFLPDTGRLDNTLWGFMCTNAFLSHNWVPEEDIDVELVSTTQLKYQIKSGSFASSIHISLVAKAMLLNLL